MPNDGSGRTTHRTGGGGVVGWLVGLVGCIARLVDWEGEDAPPIAKGDGPGLVAVPILWGWVNQAGEDTRPGTGRALSCIYI